MISTDCTNNIQFRRKIYGIIGAALTLIIPFFLMLGNANHHLDSDQSLCPFKLLTGFPCPGCGITKSLVYLYEGELYKSLSFHILGPFVVLFCIVTIGVLLTEIKTGKEYCNNYLYNRKAAYGLAFFLGLYHLIRLAYFIHANSWEMILHQSAWK